MPRGESWRPRVDSDIAAVVIGRAAELDLDDAPTTDATLDEQALIDIGREVGVSPAAVRQALHEYQAGLLQAEAPEERSLVGPRLLVVERTVPGPVEGVDAALSSFLSRKVLDCSRRAGHRSVWHPREGLLASLQRAGKRLSRERPLEDVTEITVTLSEVPAPGATPSVRIRIEAECRALRRGLATAAIGGMALGGGGAVATAGAAIAMGDPTPLLGLPPLSALAAGAYLGPRHVYASKLADVETILQGGLDQLVPAPGPR